MTKTCEQGKAEIVKLAGYFAANAAAFHDPGIREADVCASLVEPLFVALGWDVRNTQMVAPQNREVIPQEKLDDEGHSKTPDYAFRARTTPKFYVEAKKPAANIQDDPAPAYQLRRYAWTAKLPLSVLTNFKEFAVYDGRVKPAHTDAAGKARIWYFTFEDYETRWQEIWDLFSYEAVLGGRFDHFVESKKGKRGTSTVDAEFLKEIEGWRDVLARNIALRNPELSGDDLNRAVQLTIDRIIFLRMAEDRGIEPEERLLKLAERPDIYRRFVKEVCRTADDKYNSGLFHFDREPGIETEPDKLTPGLAVDDKVLRPILTDLYFPSPYAFRAMPVEILGNIYEQFLGKVIRLTKGHQARVEEKPEVRKAGGVYYTPAYIVDYIVAQTVGPLVEGKSPAQMAGKGNGHPLRVLDMACGSGSFLLGAYEFLLAHCLQWYMDNGPEKWKGAVWQPNGHAEWRLTIGERKRILTTHVFGVDIDPQAVEVTKLSLLLKVLEGETNESLGRQSQLKLFDDRALPNLDRNIRCGNSLVGPDYRDGSQLIADDEELARIKPFDWDVAFPQAIKDGGFDCIIGNPPYGRDVLSEFKEYFAPRYESLQYKVDSFVLFIERAAKLKTAQGRLGYIVPNTWLTTERYANLRHFLLARCRIEKLVNLGKDVFPGANIDTMLVFSGASRKRSIEVLNCTDHGLGAARLEHPVSRWKAAISGWSANPGCEFDVHAEPGLKAVFSRAVNSTTPLGEIAEVSQGLIPYNTKEMSRKDPYLSTEKKGAEWKRLLDRGSCVGRYTLSWNGVYVKFGPWLYTANQPKFYENPKILVQRHRNPSLKRRIVATFDGGKYYFKDNLCGIIAADDRYDLKYLLGIINSTFMNRFYCVTFTEVSLNPTYLRRLPIATIDFSDKAAVKRHDRMVALVEDMLSLQQSLGKASSEHARSVLRHQIESTDAEIDRLVYGLYGLDDDEIALIEQAEKSATRDVKGKSLTDETPPPADNAPEAGMTPEQLAEARLYGRYSLACTLADKALDLLYLGFAAAVLARPLDRWLTSANILLEHYATLRLLALLFIILALHVVVSLPLSFYSGYVLEHRFQLSTLTVGGWIRRYAKNLLLLALFAPAMYGGLYWIIWTMGRWWWLVAAVAFFFVSMVLGRIVPLVVIPFLYKVDRLDRPDLDERMDALAAGTGLSIEGVYRLALSEETVKANAMLAGLGRSRRVLLGDTLLNNFTPDEIAVVFAHEIGHHVFRHVHKMMAIGFAVSLAGFWVCDRVLMGGIHEQDYATLPVLFLPRIMLVLAVFMLVLEPLMNALSRRHERQCDRYALRRTGQPAAYVSAFSKLARQNKDDPCPHWLEVLWLHDHPPIAERLAMAQER